MEYNYNGRKYEATLTYACSSFKQALKLYTTLSSNNSENAFQLCKHRDSFLVVEFEEVK